MMTSLTTDSGLSHALASAVSAVADAELTRDTVRVVGDRLLHGIGVALIGTRFSPFRASVDALRPESGAATVLARKDSLSPGAAAFANAVAAHSCLQEDCGPGGFAEGSHPGTYIIPAALAAVESVGGSGERLTRGLIAGYEAVSLLGEIMPPGMAARRYRPSGIMGTFGAAVAAAHIWGGSVETIAYAIGIASNSASGSNQGFISGTIEPFTHAGFAARNGLLAAQLACSGAKASPFALEGPYGFFEVYAGEQPLPLQSASPMQPPAIARLQSKKYAVCLQNQETLELANELVSQLRGRSISRVRLTRPATAANGTASAGVGADGPYSEMLQRQMSAKFSVAAALLGRNVTDPSYFDSAGSDLDAARLADLVDLVTGDDDAIDVRVSLQDGEEVAVRGRRAEILRPSSETIDLRFLSRASAILDGASADAALTIVRTLIDQPELSALSRALRG